MADESTADKVEVEPYTHMVDNKVGSGLALVVAGKGTECLDQLFHLNRCLSLPGMELQHPSSEDP